jgi:hypothetical protein
VRGARVGQIEVEGSVGFGKMGRCTEDDYGVVGDILKAKKVAVMRSGIAQFGWRNDWWRVWRSILRESNREEEKYDGGIHLY